MTPHDPHEGSRETVDSRESSSDHGGKYVRRFCGCGKPIEEHWCDAPRETDVAICSCGDALNVRYDTVPMYGGHRPQCPVAQSIEAEIARKREELHHA